MHSNDDAYTNCFLQKVICRKSCFSCPYCLNTLEGDITIGDLKKQYEQSIRTPYNRNGSIILSHTSAGDEICSHLDEKMAVYHLNEEAIDYPAHGKQILEKRDAFFRDYAKNTGDIAALLNSYAMKKSMTLRIWSSIPDKIRGKIKRMIRWFRK